MMFPRISQWVVSAAIACVCTACITGCGEREPEPQSPETSGTEAVTPAAPQPVVRHLLPPDSPTAQPDEEPATLGDLQRDAAQTIGTAGTLAAQTKDQLLAASLSKLDMLKTKLDDARELAAAQGAQAKAKFDELKSGAEVKMDHAKTKVAELQESSDQAWQSLSDGLRKAVAEVELAVDEAVGAFGDDAADTDD